MTNFRQFLDLEVKLTMLLFVFFEEVFKILVHRVQKLVNFLSGWSHTLLCLLYLFGHLKKSNFSIMTPFFVVVVDFVKEYFTDFNQLIMIKSIIFISSWHFKIAIDKVWQFVNLIVRHDDTIASLCLMHRFLCRISPTAWWVFSGAVGEAAVFFWQQTASGFLSLIISLMSSLIRRITATSLFINSSSRINRLGIATSCSLLFIDGIFGFFVELNYKSLNIALFAIIRQDNSIKEWNLILVIQLMIPSLFASETCV